MSIQLHPFSDHFMWAVVRSQIKGVRLQRKKHMLLRATGRLRSRKGRKETSSIGKVCHKEDQILTVLGLEGKTSRTIQMNVYLLKMLLLLFLGGNIQKLHRYRTYYSMEVCSHDFPINRSLFSYWNSSCWHLKSKVSYVHTCYFRTLISPGYILIMCGKKWSIKNQTATASAILYDLVYVLVFLP